MSLALWLTPYRVWAWRQPAIGMHAQAVQVYICSPFGAHRHSHNHARNTHKSIQNNFHKFRFKSERVVVTTEWVLFLGFYRSIELCVYRLLSTAHVPACAFMCVNAWRTNIHFLNENHYYRLASSGDCRYDAVNTTKPNLYADNQRSNQRRTSYLRCEHRLLFFGEKYFLIKVNRCGIV